jgi:hypothetical protein
VAVDQRKLIAVLRDAVDGTPERYRGYHNDLLDHVSQVVLLEREHERKATQIQKKVSDKIDALSVLIDKNEESTA